MDSLVLFPGESQQGERGEGGLLAIPSVKSRDQSELPAASTAAAAVNAEEGSSLKASPFSGMTEFNLFLGDPLPPVTAQPAGEALGEDPQHQGVTPADTAFPPLAAAETSVPFVQGGPNQLLQSEYSQGLLGLLASADFPDQQQQQPQPALAEVQAHNPAIPQQQTPLVASPFGVMLPPQQLQQLGLGSGQPAASAPAGGSGTLTPPTPQQQLMPPPLPLPAAAALQPQMQFQAPLISPLLLHQPFSFGAPHPAAGMHPQFGMSPVMELPVPLQPQQQQRVSGDAHSGDGDAMSDGEGGGDHSQRAGGQPKRRGRPPKVPGQYSKGYEAIKRYREKKKGMVSSCAGVLVVLVVLLRLAGSLCTACQVSLSVLVTGG